MYKRTQISNDYKIVIGEGSMKVEDFLSINPAKLFE